MKSEIKYYMKNGIKEYPSVMRSWNINQSYRTFLNRLVDEPLKWSLYLEIMEYSELSVAIIQICFLMSFLNHLIYILYIKGLLGVSEVSSSQKLTIEETIFQWKYCAILIINPFHTNSLWTAPFKCCCWGFLSRMLLWLRYVQVFFS